MLKTQIIGHLGNDAIVNNVNSKTVINFNVAHSESWTDNTGVKNQKSIWVSCSYWTEKTSIGQYLKKGTQVYVEGSIDCKIYTANNGVAQPQLTCRVMNIQLLGGNKEGHPATTPAVNQNVVNSDISTSNDDLPF